MRRSPFIALVFLTGTFSQAHAAASVLHAKVSIAGCAQPITLTLRKSSGKGDIDQSGFDQIIFRIGAQTFQFYTETPQVQASVLNPPEDYTKLKGVSVDKSGFFLHGSYSTGSTERPLLLFLGWPYASDPGSILVLGFHSDCSPYRVLQLETYELTAIQKDASAITTLIGKPSLSQVMAGADGAWMAGKPYATTYDPYSVYRINPTKGLAEYSLKDSRLYNQAHYCWAGPHMSEAKAVVYNRTKKGAIECMSANRALELFR